MKIGISLSGGGARGIVHLGVLSALEDLEVPIHKIAGVSSGAIVGSFYAQGFSPQETLERIRQTRLLSLLRPSSFTMPGLFSLETVGNLLKEHLEDSFDNLKYPLVVAASDIREGEMAYFSEGELITPILASCAIPLVFNPVEYQGRLLVDGGIISTMVVRPLEEDCDFIIGVHCNPFDKDQPVSSTLAIMARCFNLSVHAGARANFPRCHVVIEPKGLNKYAPHRLDKAQEMFDLGYAITMEQKEEILDKIKMHS